VDRGRRRRVGGVSGETRAEVAVTLPTTIQAELT
jgi:hypothetical protein